MARALVGAELEEFLKTCSPDFVDFASKTPDIQKLMRDNGHYPNILNLLQPGLVARDAEGAVKVYDNATTSWALAHGLENHPTRRNPRYGSMSNIELNPKNARLFELGDHFERMTVVDGLLDVTYEHLRSPSHYRLQLRRGDSGIIPAGATVVFTPLTARIDYICEFDKLGFAGREEASA